VNKLDEQALEVYTLLKEEFTCFWDRSGSIGRRYARADEIGIPLCITVDFETTTEKTVTIRDRDSCKQIRVNLLELSSTLHKLLHGGEFEKLGKSV
jgi:glycyl-tRNA synthetase